MFKYLRQKAIKDKAVSLIFKYYTNICRITYWAYSRAYEKTTVAKYGKTCVIAGFRREVDEICVLLGYYVAYSGNSSPQVLGQPVGPIFKDQGTDP